MPAPGPPDPSGWDELVRRLNTPQSNPALEGLRGFAQGASPIPLQSGQSTLHQIAQLMGLMFGIPSAYDALGTQMNAAGQAMSHPGQTIGAIGQGMAQNPAHSAGFMLGAMLPFGWHKFDPKIGALDEAGNVVRTTDMIRHWNPKAGGAEKAFNEMMQTALEKKASEHLQAARIPQWRDAQRALQATQVEHILNTQVDPKFPNGGIVRIPATPFTKELHYVKQPTGWERLRALDLGEASPGRK